MLRRPPTTLSLTAEDIAAYEDRRYEQLQAQAQAHAQLQPRSQPAHALMSRHPRTRLSAMDTTTSSPNDSTDEAMEDVAAPAADLDDDDDEEEQEDGEEDDDDDDDPFSTRGDLRAAGGTGRPMSPGARRSAYLSQMRARGGRHGRSQSHTHTTSIPTSTSTYTSAAPSRAQRIMGSASASALPSAPTSGQSSQVPAHLQQTPVQNTAPGGTTTTRAGAGRAGRQASEPPPAPTRVTRSRDERIGIAPGPRPADTGPGGAAGPTMRRR
ncbi:hypothetical protein F5B22DRAFT_129995 [Xylaria bambusicola]|uniref:uncharacterized protein n=1 Tax=Xylaria bambusicola TaxID=326684 RepID=UPI002008C92B|nr:uncharacterized protein F5B22DRAFT_129995 [Xylaria bambusicola]KAI0517140.1 hypothetical protein F5B22DRAFT_129995 [Xylaria bambusicola]